MKILVLLIFLSFTKFGLVDTLNYSWTKVAKGQTGHEFFVNMKNINENKNFIYFWQLINYKVIDEYGDLSAKIYIQGNCKSFKFKWIKVSYHKLLMAKDKVIAKKPASLVSGWQYPEIGSTSYRVLDYVCSNKGLLL